MLLNLKFLHHLSSVSSLDTSCTVIDTIDMFHIKPTNTMGVINRLTWCVKRGLLRRNSNQSLKAFSTTQWIHNQRYSSKNLLQRPYIKKGPGLEYFLYNSKSSTDNLSNKEATPNVERHPYLDKDVLDGAGRKGKHIVSPREKTPHHDITFSLQFLLKCLAAR